VKSVKKTGKASRRRIPVALKLLVLVCVAFASLLLLLPQPPEIESGGSTIVTRRLPDLRDTVNPLARTKVVEESIPAPSPASVLAPSPDPVLPKKPPETKTVLLPPELAPPGPARKPQITIPPDIESEPEQKPKPLIKPKTDVARLTPEPAPGGRVDLPSKSDIREWLKSQAWEFLGGVDEAGNILYRFEVWLDVPSDTLLAVKSVSYVYDAPSATPPSRDSDISDGGFRVRFGGMSCAQKVTVKLTMSDGRSRRAVVDGCRALN
jgi:hypothetical protein